MQSVRSWLASPPVLWLALFLSGCTGTNYQAPVSDRSSTVERRAPVIVNRGQAAPVSTSRRELEAPGSSSTPATQNSSPVGASTTVVRAVTLGSISRDRQAIESAPVGGRGGSSDGFLRAEGSLPANGSPSADGSSEPASPGLLPPEESPSAGNGNTVESLLPPTRPAVEEAAQEEASQGVTTEAPESYVVTRGDTLYSIAWNHDMDYRRLALANDLSEPYTIYPGQRLMIDNVPLSEAEISALPDIPAAPAGEEALPGAGQRPQVAIEGRRTGSVPIRMVDDIRWQWPADGRLLSRFSTTGISRGIDIAGSKGESVYAAADGDVVFAGRGIQGAGNLVILRHGARHLSAYMHNSLMLVVEGDRVHAGDKIAEIGTGPEGRDLLHFEVRVDGKPVDPSGYLPSR